MRPSARCQGRRQFCVAGRQRFCAPPLPLLDDRRDILHMRLQNARFSAAKGRWLPWPFHGVWQIRPYAVHPGGRRCADSQSGAASTWHGQYTPAPEHFRNAGPETGICRPPFQEQACIFVQGLLHALLAFSCRWSVFEKEKNPQFGGDFPLVFAKNSERQNGAKDVEIAFQGIFKHTPVRHSMVFCSGTGKTPADMLQSFIRT